MTDIFDMCAAPLREMILNQEISLEAGELFLGALAWFVPVVVLSVCVWAVCRLFACLVNFAGGASK